MNLTFGERTLQTSAVANPGDSSTGRTPQRTYFPALDGLRSVAVLLVFWHHFGPSKYSSFGWAGVDLFFVLSGFLITGILIDTVDSKTYFADFYWRRTLRIFPVIYLVLGVLLAVTPFLDLKWNASTLGAFFYVGNVTALKGAMATVLRPYVFVGHFWSLAIEEQFYLVWPFALLFLWRKRIVIPACLVLIVIALLLRLVTLAFLPSALASFGLPPVARATLLMMDHYLLPMRMDSLLVGGVVAAVLRSDQKERWKRMFKISGMVAGFLLLLLCTAQRSFAAESTGMCTFGFTLVALASAGLIVHALDTGTRSYRLLNSRVPQFVGKRSYGFYVYHYLPQPAIAIFVGGLQTRMHSKALGWSIGFTVALTYAFVASTLSFHFFERPFLNLKDRFPIRRRKPAVLMRTEIRLCSAAATLTSTPSGAGSESWSGHSGSANHAR